MRRIDTMSKDNILDMLIQVVSENYSNSLCKNCPMHESHNPCCNNDDMRCEQSFIYYLTEEI